jgi:hypothetical protein
MLDGQAEALTAKAVELALDGDGTALRLCLERILPARRDRPVNFQLPSIKSASDAAAAMASITEAVASGQLTPSEAALIGQLVDATVHALDASELTRRIEALEQRADESSDAA